MIPEDFCPVKYISFSSYSAKGLESKTFAVSDYADSDKSIYAQELQITPGLPFVPYFTVEPSLR